MIPVRPAPEPPTFDAEVRQPGLRALAEMVGETPTPRRVAGKAFGRVSATRDEIPPERLPAYWTRVLDDLMDAYDSTCAYACMRIHRVTGARSVDHMAPKSRRWDAVYEWTNYRLACQQMNACKRDFGDVVDPFEVGEGWFEIELHGFQVRPAPGLAPEITVRVEQAIARLGLNAWAFRSAREQDYDRYINGDVSLRVLREESPFLAGEVERQGHAPDPTSHRLGPSNR